MRPETASTSKQQRVLRGGGALAPDHFTDAEAQQPKLPSERACHVFPWQRYATLKHRSSARNGIEEAKLVTLVSLTWRDICTIIHATLSKPVSGDRPKLPTRQDLRSQPPA